jgi:hypothetical protein
MGDFNLPKFVMMDFEDFGFSPLGVTADLKANLIDCNNSTRFLIGFKPFSIFSFQLFYAT